jgi:hypothetical protein
MAGIVQNSAPRDAEASVRSGDTLSPAARSAIRTDAALLVSALFLQRFNLPFLGGKSVALSVAPVAVILAWQFAAGRLLISYDRLLWFLLLALSATVSLLLNFKNISFTSYALFLVLYLFFIFMRPSAVERYKNTLQSFQFLVLIISCLAIIQFPAQFIIDPTRLLMFYGIFPQFLLPPLYKAGVNTIGTIAVAGHAAIKSNGIFLTEPSTMSQIAAIAILVEALEFRRPRYLMILTMGLLLAYSGTGISILLISLPLAFVVNRRAQMPVLLIGIFVIGLLATGIIHLSAFTARFGEFENTRASGFIRFVAPFWQAADYLRTASLTDLLSGKGPGYGFLHSVVFYAASSDTWFKLFLEYGAVGAFIFVCFFVSCFRNSRCPTPLIAGLTYNFLFTGNSLLDPSYITIVMVLCTLNAPEPRRRGSDRLRQYRTAVAE